MLIGAFAAAELHRWPGMQPTLSRRTVVLIAAGVIPITATWITIKHDYFLLCLSPDSVFEQWERERDDERLVQAMRCWFLPSSVRDRAAYELVQVRHAGRRHPDAVFALPDAEVDALNRKVSAIAPGSYDALYERFPGGHVHPRLAAVIRDDAEDLDRRTMAFLLLFAHYPLPVSAEQELRELYAGIASSKLRAQIRRYGLIYLGKGILTKDVLGLKQDGQQRGQSLQRDAADTASLNSTVSSPD